MRVGPTVHLGGLSVRFLGLELGGDGAEVYEVLSRAVAGGTWEPGHLGHVGEGSWDLTGGDAVGRRTVPLGRPDEVFAVAMGAPALSPESLAEAAAHWPVALRGRLARRRASGPCTIAFDGQWFVARLCQTPIDRPLLFPGAAEKLGLTALLRAGEIVAAAAAGEDSSLLELLQRGLSAPSRWSGEGRLIGESTWGDLSQVGADIAEGCKAALGRGPLRVSFDPHAPMGLGFGPEVPSAEVAAGRQPAAGASAGLGAEVGVVDAGGAAEAAGVTEGMVVTALSSPELLLHVDGEVMPFEDVLDAIDARRSAGARLVMTFATAAPLTHWYAVEMPAASTLSALSGDDPPRSVHEGLGASLDALCGPALLWQEPIPRLFLGAPGSVTCAHIDICPQVQLAHGLLGTKVLGVASHAATPRLLAEHGGAGEGAIDEGATHVPTDRPLSTRQARLLKDPEVTLLLLRRGDLAVLHSGAIHFASNGAEALSGALYQGIITPGALPRLREAAAGPGGSRPGGDDAYGEHLYAKDLLALVAPKTSRSQG